MTSPHPDYFSPAYRSTTTRAPAQPLLTLPAAGDLPRVPTAAPEAWLPQDADLTRQSSAPPLGERIVVSGRVLDAQGRPVRRSLVELWQCNAAGRYHHAKDRHEAPLDPHFLGWGKTLTDDDGWYRFMSIKPGAYPWGNHSNAWRPAHIHFSLFGNSYAQRLVTQMYFPGDPLLALDPIYNSVPEVARVRLISAFDIGLTQEGIALGYRFDIVLGGRRGTPTGL